MLVSFKFKKEEIAEILKHAEIIVDTREQANQHIIDYFIEKKIPYEEKKLDHGDYSIKVPPLPQFQISRPIYLPVVIEKKNSIDELASSFKDRTRFESEFIRGIKNNTTMYLLVEDVNGYANILNQKYRSKYTPKALMGSLKAFETRYNLKTAFIDKQYCGDWIYRTLMYELREFLLK